jgi:hypothetical protein
MSNIINFRALIGKDEVSIDFTYENTQWSANCTYDYRTYLAKDITFAPLKTTQFKQIESLLNTYECDSKLVSNKIMLSWYISIMDQNIVVQLNGEELDTTGELAIQLRKQQDIINWLQTRVIELEKKNEKMYNKLYPIKYTLQSKNGHIKVQNKEDESEIKKQIIKHLTSTIPENLTKNIIDQMKQTKTLTDLFQIHILGIGYVHYIFNYDLIINVLHSMKYKLDNESVIGNDMTLIYYSDSYKNVTSVLNGYKENITDDIVRIPSNRTHGFNYYKYSYM